MDDEKRITTLVMSDGSEKEIEIIYVVNIENKGDYVIYKLDDDFYGAKYEYNGEDTELNADLSDEEKEALNKAFEKMVVENA